MVPAERALLVAAAGCLTWADRLRKPYHCHTSGRRLQRAAVPPETDTRRDRGGAVRDRRQA